MQPASIRVGELAEQTGLSVRTLHHYDEMGLLSPSQRTEGGHRLYAAGDIARLQRIVSLRQLGFSLEEIRDCLDRPDFSPARVIGLHISRLKEQIKLQQGLCKRLEAIAERLEATEGVSVAEFLETIGVMSMLDRYTTPEQRAELEERGRLLGPERIRQVEAEWRVLIEEVRAEMDRGTDPTSEAARALARRWTTLVREFSGGDRAIEGAVATMYRQEPGMLASVRQRGYGLDPKMFEYIAKATST